MHSSITMDRIAEAMMLADHMGMCVDCGADAHGVEPDAEKYECDECGKHSVCGVEQLLVMPL